MASKFIRKLKGIKLETVKEPSTPKGTVVVELHNDDVDSLGTIESDDDMRGEMRDIGSKIAIASASIECAFKAGAIVESANRQGVEIAGEKLKDRLGVSGSDHSWKDVKKSLEYTYEDLINYEKELMEHLESVKQQVKGKHDGNASEDGNASDEDGDE